MANKYTYYQFLKDFPDDDACLDTLMGLRYGRKHYCHECERETRYHRITGRRQYACQFCGAQVAPCAGTIFEKSSTPLHKWFFAMYLFTTSKHGVSGKELEAKLGVTYKTAWRMGHQIRKLMDELMMPDGLFGQVEADETYVGGRHSGGKVGRGAPGKTIVFGMKAREGGLMTKVVPDVKGKTLKPIIGDNVKSGSTVHTDELRSYNGLHKAGYEHQKVNHSEGEYARNGSHVNNLEGHWSLFKRSVRGTHVHISRKHTPKYLAEFDFRHNLRSMPGQLFHVLMLLIYQGTPVGAKR